MKRKPAFYISASYVPKGYIEEPWQQYHTVLNFISTFLAFYVTQHHRPYSPRSTHSQKGQLCSHLRFLVCVLGSHQCERANDVPTPKLSPRNELSAEQRGMPHPLHLVHFSFSINKCFHLHSSLSLTHTQSTCESWRMMCYRALQISLKA